MAHSPQNVHFPKSIQRGLVEMALVGHNSINSVSLIFSELITGLPLNTPGTFAIVTSGIYCLPSCRSIFKLFNIFTTLSFTNHDRNKTGQNFYYKSENQKFHYSVQQEPMPANCGKKGLLFYNESILL